MPKNLKSLFAFTLWGFYSHELVAPVVRRISEYPVTEVMIHPGYNPDMSDETIKEGIKAWNRLVKQDLDIKTFLVEMLYNTFCFGNSFVLIQFHTDRFLKCTTCPRTLTSNNNDAKLNSSNVDSRRPRFRHDCPQCGPNSELDIVEADHPKYKVRLLHISPINIDVEYEEVTGKRVYYYTLPAATVEKIKNGYVKDILEYDPQFVEAALTGDKLRFYENRLYHMRAPGLAEEDMGWGKPPLLAAMRAVYQMTVAKRAEEAILLDHSAPFRVVFPQSTGNTDAPQQIGLSRWKAAMRTGIRTQRFDPNYIMFSPVPLGSTSFGGDARGLSIIPSMEYLKLVILNCLGMPRELYEGGFSFSGSSMSLRIAENKFISMRQETEKFLAWFKDSVRDVMHYCDANLVHKRLKMADDVQKTDTAIRLMQMGYLSPDTVLADLDDDAEEERKKISMFLGAKAEQDEKNAIAAANAQAKGSVIMAKAQVQAQMEQQKLQAALQAEAQEEDEAKTQSRRRALLKTLPPPNIDAYVRSGNVSVADIIYMLNEKIVPWEVAKGYVAGIKQMESQALQQFGIDPTAMANVPPVLALKIDSHIITPVEISQALAQIFAAPPPAGGAPQEGGEGGGGGQEGGGEQQPPEARAADMEKALNDAPTPQERSILESKMKTSDPEAFKMMGQKPQDNRPQPEQRPPRRDGGQT
jgi:hypothetical protein